MLSRASARLPSGSPCSRSWLGLWPGSSALLRIQSLFLVSEPYIQRTENLGKVKGHEKACILNFAAKYSYLTSQIATVSKIILMNNVSVLYPQATLSLWHEGSFAFSSPSCTNLTKKAVITVPRKSQGLRSRGLGAWPRRCLCCLRASTPIAALFLSVPRWLMCICLEARTVLG